jgi:hypothetical protein
MPNLGLVAGILFFLLPCAAGAETLTDDELHQAIAALKPDPDVPLPDAVMSPEVAMAGWAWYGEARKLHAIILDNAYWDEPIFLGFNLTEKEVLDIPNRKVPMHDLLSQGWRIGEPGSATASAIDGQKFNQDCLNDSYTDQNLTLAAQIYLLAGSNGLCGRVYAEADAATGPHHAEARADIAMAALDDIDNLVAALGPAAMFVGDFRYDEITYQRDSAYLVAQSSGLLDAAHLQRWRSRPNDARAEIMLQLECWRLRWGPADALNHRDPSSSPASYPSRFIGAFASAEDAIAQDEAGLGHLDPAFQPHFAYTADIMRHALSRASRHRLALLASTILERTANGQMMPTADQLDLAAGPWLAKLECPFRHDDSIVIRLIANDQQAPPLGNWWPQWRPPYDYPLEHIRRNAREGGRTIFAVDTDSLIMAIPPIAKPDGATAPWAPGDPVPDQPELTYEEALAAVANRTAASASVAVAAAADHAGDYLPMKFPEILKLNYRGYFGSVNGNDDASGDVFGTARDMHIGSTLVDLATHRVIRFKGWSWICTRHFGVLRIGAAQYAQTCVWMTDAQKADFAKLLADPHYLPAGLALAPDIPEPPPEDVNTPVARFPDGPPPATAVPPLAIPAQASAHGTDCCGYWCDVNVGGQWIQRMRWIPPGTFLMGSPPGESGYDNEFQHRVTLTHGFWMADCPCTQQMWRGMGEKDHSSFHGQELPVENVTYTACQDFIARINAEYPGIEARLPTEAEWEYACRVGTTTPYYGPDLDALGWYRDNSDVTTHRVRLKAPNTWGLFDMHGNVADWCLDYYDGDYPHTDETDPLRPLPPNGDSSHILRGGGWKCTADNCRSAYRIAYPENTIYNFFSFRFIIGSPMPKAAP